MVLDPAGTVLAGLDLLIPVLAGNDVEPAVLIYVGYLSSLALAQVDGVLVEGDLVGGLGAPGHRVPDGAAEEGQASDRKSNKTGRGEGSDYILNAVKHSHLLLC